MIRQFSKIIGSHVLSYAEGEPLAVVSDAIVHPDTGRIEGFWVEPVSGSPRHAVLPAEAIVAWKKNLYIKDAGQIAEAEDIIRISEILSRKEYFVGNRVLGESGKGYGRVVDFDFDDGKLYLRYLLAQKSFLFLKGGQRYFRYDDIVQVFPTHILVKDGEGKEAKEASLAENRGAVLDS